ncbi:TraR/DksA C4-type zinc finger protein [Cohnella sp. JJ-181]|uniref:TraR/DksA C4-type zinc finger protein n=1 Tax=Cohnella rhizoplanae TaxID=2974897 RepID=UPI0022FFA80E|nr:TraR/DksA C4-type zinc finger protein [Cohnella sp. JJ-181]CAI6020678.1 RNA polymerase-binding transcription factor DksA [Cohnella sp. JJ-181]
MHRTLSDSFMSQQRARLLERRADIESRIGANGHFGLEESYRDATGELSGIDNHPADAGTETFERGKDLSLLERQALTLEKIEAAIRRMDTGEYGICAACGKFIDPERLEAMPTAVYCMEHEPIQQEKEGRPVEELFLYPPFGRTSLDEKDDAHEQNGFDGEDAWQIVESWGNADSPAMAEGNNNDDYNAIYIESDENDGFVEPIESFLAADITGRTSGIVRNRAYRRYLELHEGEGLLEPDVYTED